MQCRLITNVSNLGRLLSPKSYVDCLADLENLTFSIPIFLPNFPPISIPFSKEKHPILTELAAFYNNLPKIHTIYVIWAPSSLMKTSDRYTKFCEKSAPKGRHIYVYRVNVRTPPPGIQQQAVCVFGKVIQCILLFCQSETQHIPQY